MKKLIKISFALGTAAVIALGLLVALAYFYEDEIVEGVQLKINQKLDAKVAVESVNFSVIERFPYASIRFNKVWIEDKNIKGDTLLYSDVLYLSFNMVDFIRKKYVIKQAEINNGTICMRQQKDGITNYIFWKETSDEPDASVEFDIEDLILKDIDYRYLFQKDKFVLTGQIDELKLSGNIDKSGMVLQNETEFLLKELSYDNMTYLVDQNTKLEGEILLNETYEQLVFNNFTLSFGDMSMPITGEIFKKEKHWNIDLSTNNSSNISDILSVLSDDVKNQFSDYKLKGEMKYDANLIGAIDDRNTPLLRINFQLENGKIEENNSGVALENMHFKGAYQSLQKASERIEIESLSANLAGGNFNITGGLENLASPWLNMHLEANFNLRTLGKFLRWEEIQDLAGEVTLQTDFKGPFPNKDLSKIDIDRLKMSGNMQLSGMNLKLKGSSQEFSSLEGEVIFNDDDLRIKTLQGSVNGNNFKANGELSGFMHYLFDKQDKLYLAGTIESDFIDLNTLLVEEGDVGNEEHFEFNDKLDFNLSANIQGLKFKQFEAKDITGNMRLKGDLLKIDNISFVSAGGEIKGDLEIKNAKENNFSVSSQVNISKVDIRQVFKQFEDFGQNFIQSTHIKGISTATINYSSIMDAKLDIKPHSIICDADITINDGELINLEAMQDIYKAMNENKILRSSIDPSLKTALSHIKFSTLKNRIQIRRGNVSIPEMNIKSSAMDVNISGTHSIENEIDYHLDFRLRDILTKRSESEFGPIADDGTGMNIFILMNGTADNPNYSIDWKKKKEKRKENFVAEKNIAKTILKEELGLFKNHKSTELPEDKPEDKPIITVTTAKDESKLDKRQKKKEEELFEVEDDDF